MNNPLRRVSRDNVRSRLVKKSPETGDFFGRLPAARMAASGCEQAAGSALTEDRSPRTKQSNKEYQTRVMGTIIDSR